MEHPNATWNDFSTHCIHKDGSFQVSSNFLSDEELTKAELATLGQEVKKRRTELQEHRVNVVEGTSKPVDQNQNGRQNATRVCNYCHTNGHTPSWFKKKIQNEELKKIENERTAEKRVTFAQAYNKKKEDQAMSPESGITIRNLHTELIRIMDSIIRTVDDRFTDYQIISPIETMKSGRIMQISTTKMEIGELLEIFLVHHQDKDETFLKVIHSTDLNLFNLEIRHVEDQKVTQTLVPLLEDKNFR